MIRVVVIATLTTDPLPVETKECAGMGVRMKFQSEALDVLRRAGWIVGQVAEA